MSVDFALFPLDSLKTNIQCGFKGNRRIFDYSGLSPHLIVSFPAAATFFTVYDYSKFVLRNRINSDYGVNAIAACLGEVSQNLVRNPFELVKQNLQLKKYSSVRQAVYGAISNNSIMV